MPAVAFCATERIKQHERPLGDVGGPGVAPGTEMGTRNSLLLAITLVSLGPPVVRIARILGRATLPHSHSLHGRQV